MGDSVASSKSAAKSDKSGKTGKTGASAKSSKSGKRSGKGPEPVELTPEEEAEAAAVAEFERRREAEEAKALAEEDAFVKGMCDEALERAVGEISAEQEAARQAYIMEKLAEKGKVMVDGRQRCVVDGDVAEVRAYDPKEGRYIAQLPSGKLVKVHPSQVTRYVDPPPAADDATVVSKYSSLKTW
jgi:hypothetical protein